MDKQPKAWMDYMFDHTMIIAEDDPELRAFQQMDEARCSSSKSNTCYWR